MRVWIFKRLFWLSLFLVLSACRAPSPNDLNATATPAPSPAPTTTPQVTLTSFILFSRSEFHCTPGESVRTRERRVWFQAPNLYRTEDYDANGSLTHSSINNARENWNYEAASKTAFWSQSQNPGQDVPFVSMWDIAALQANKLAYQTARFLGEEQLLGRSALKFEIFERPEQSGHPRPYCTGYNLATTILVDRATQVQLESMSGTRDQEYHFYRVTRFDVNPTIEAATFEFAPPPGTQPNTNAKDLIEFHKTIPTAWHQVASRLPFALFIPRNIPDGYTMPTTPKYDGDPSHGVVLEYVAPNAKPIVIIERSIVGFSMPTNGEPVKLRNRSGIYRTDGATQSLVFVRNKTAIELRTDRSLAKQDLIDMAMSLVNVPKK